MSLNKSIVQCVHGKGFRCRTCWPVSTKWVTLEISELEVKHRVESLVPPTPADLYRKRASELFKVTEAAVTPEQRRFAKIQMFREIYST